MNLLKTKIIEEIINQLKDLKTIYNDEIDIIINDLLNNNKKSLNEFINKYYKDTEISNEMKLFVKSLVEKEIIEARKIYLDDAKGFISNLETKNEDEIYTTLLNFYDISLMQHCIKNLNEDTLNKLFKYVETKLKNNPHNAMDMFLEGSIKSHLKNT